MNALGDEHRNFLKRPFIYNNTDYIAQILEQMTYFKDYMGHHLGVEVSSRIDSFGNIID